MNDVKKYLIALLVTGVSLILAWQLYSSEQRYMEEIERVGRIQLDVESDVIEARSSGERAVTLYLFSGELGTGNFLVPEERMILETGDSILTARQIVVEILKGPPRLVDTEPRVREVYLLPDGTAVVDLPSDVTGKLRGGTLAELALLRSITRSLVANLREVRQVRFLVEGQTQPTLAGHISLHHPFM